VGLRVGDVDLRARRLYVRRSAPEVEGLWNTAIKQAGVAPLTIRDLRHTYASMARAAGADLRFVQRTLGHSSPVVTANIDSDLYDSEWTQSTPTLTGCTRTVLSRPDKTGQ
jgi:integrase